MIVLGLGFGRGIEVLGLVLGLESGPCPWPWPRLIDSVYMSRPDAKLADICTQMDFVPLGYLFERILGWLFLPAQPLLKVFFLTVGWSSAHIVRKRQTSCWNPCCLPSVLFSADCCVYIVMVSVRGVANFVIIVIFFGCSMFSILLCQLSLTVITYPFIHKLTKYS